MILFFLAFPFFIFSVKEQIFYNSKYVSFSGSKSTLSFSDSWYFAKISDDDAQSMQKDGHLSIKKLYSNWHILFLSPSQAASYKQKYDIKLKAFSNDDKLLDVTKSSGLFFAEFLENYKPEDTLETKFLNLLENIYQVNTTDINLVLEIPELLSISDAPVNELHNRWVAGIIQDFGPPRMTEYGFQGNRYLKEHGISGEGLSVTIVDSGLDVNNSFFYDPDHQFSFDILNRDHRKIILYNAYGNTRDATNGHGTHTSGTAAGKSMCNNEMSLYNGVADDSKIHFIDISNNEKSTSLLNYPITLLSMTMAVVKSYVNSNSWGSSTRSVSQTKLYDMAAKYLPDRLFAFSAGNSGLKGYITINSPGDGKNILTVGSLGRTYGQYFSDATKNLVLYDENDKTFSLSQFSGIDAFQLTKGIYKCETTTNLNNVDDKVFLTSNPDDICSLYGSLRAAIIASTTTPSCTSSSFPVFLTSASPQEILNISKATVNIEISKEFFTPSVDSTSSRGPAYYGIAKPDIVSPGHQIYSAAANYDLEPGSGCSLNNLIEKTGTSMACPSIAGLATLVNQYFLDGFYPTGKKNPTDSFVPGSSLVRALVILSADKLGANWYPSMDYGHGIADIKNVLKFSDNEYDEKLKIFKDVTIHQGDYKYLKFKVKEKDDGNKKPLRIGMAYLDQPDSSDSSPLIVDLDMYIITPSGKTLYGNQKLNGHEEHFSTFEKIVLDTDPNNEDQVEAGEYTLFVYGGGNFASLRNKFMQFSLCIVGQIDENSFTDWMLLDDEYKNITKCTFPNVGINCQITAEEINGSLNQTQFYTLFESMENYFYINMPKNWNNVTITLKRDKEYPGHIKIQLGFDKLPFTPYSYDLIYVTGNAAYQINLKRSQLKVSSLSFFGVRITNVSPSREQFNFQFSYDRYSPPIPTRSPVPRTWSSATIVTVSIGYSLAGVFFVAFIAFLYLYISSKRYIERQEKERIVRIQQHLAQKNQKIAQELKQTMENSNNSERNIIEDPNVV